MEEGRIRKGTEVINIFTSETGDVLFSDTSNGQLYSIEDIVEISSKLYIIRNIIRIFRVNEIWGSISIIHTCTNSEYGSLTEQFGDDVMDIISNSNS